MRAPSKNGGARILCGCAFALKPPVQKSIYSISHEAVECQIHIGTRFYCVPANVLKLGASGCLLE